MKGLNEQQQNVSNTDADWGRIYDFYEIELREMYNTISRRQNESHFYLLKNEAMKYKGPESVFCEIGFSAGITLRYAASLFKEVYGLDISGKNVEFTRNELEAEGYKNIRLFRYDMMKPDDRFKDKFDIISLIHGLEHYSEQDYPAVFTHIRQFLKPGGLFTGALPYKGVFNYRMCPSCHHTFEVDGHVSRHDKETLAELFKKHHFEILHLDNFNRHYNWKRGPLLKKIYRHLHYAILKEDSGGQL